MICIPPNYRSESEKAYNIAIHHQYRNYNSPEHQKLVAMITESAWAFYWARDIGDVEVMKSRITEPYWLEKFENYFEVKNESRNV